MKVAKSLFLIAAVMALAACSTSPRYSGLNPADQDDKDDVRRSGATPTTHPALETVNLIELLDPKGKTEDAYKLDRKNAASPWADLSYAVRYDRIFASFSDINSYQAQPQRNLVQNRLFAASERRCGRFFQYLKKDSSDMNFRFAAATGFLSTAAALVPGMRAAQNLSGLSAFGSGLRAEYNNEYYANLAISVITRGIEEKRNEMRAQLQNKQRMDYGSYDIAAAVADAVKYDSSCNIVNGLELANEAIQRLNEPGRDAMNRALLKDRVGRALSTGDTTELKKLKTGLDELQIDTQSLLSGFTSYPVPSIYATNHSQSIYPAQPAMVSADAAQALANINRSFAGLEQELLATVNASIDELGTPSVNTITASITAVLGSISSAYSNSISGDSTATSCFVEAAGLVSVLASKQAAVQLAKARGDGLRAAQDSLDLQMGVVSIFARKLHRHEQVVREFAEAQLKNLRSSMPAIRAPKAAIDSAILKIDTQISSWTVDALQKSVGDLLACKKG